MWCSSLASNNHTSYLSFITAVLVCIALLAQYHLPHSYADHGGDQAPKELLASSLLKYNISHDPPQHVSKDTWSYNFRLPLHLDNSSFVATFDEPSPSLPSHSLPPIFILNLDRAPHRWEQTKEELNKAHIDDHEVHRFSAVDGRKFTQQDLESNTTTLGRLFQPKGVLACFLSHRTFWQYVIDNDLDRAIIMEDDLVLVPGFREGLVKAIGELDSLPNTDNNVDVLLLGAIGRVDPEGVESLFAFLFSWFQGGIRERKVVSESLHVPSRPGGTHAYLVTKQGAKKLIELLPKANYHVDMVAWGQLSLNILLVKPMLVFQRFAELSVTDAATPTNGKDLADSFFKPLLMWMRTSIMDCNTKQTFHHGYYQSYFYLWPNGPLLIAGYHVVFSLCATGLFIIFWTMNHVQWAMIVTGITLIVTLSIQLMVWILINVTI